mgnify:CR=1 FL=1
MNNQRYLLSYRTRSNQFWVLLLDERGLSVRLSRNLGAHDVPPTPIRYCQLIESALVLHTHQYGLRAAVISCECDSRSAAPG